MKKILLSTLMAISVLTAANNAKDMIKGPATKLEKVQSIKGSIIVKGYNEASSLYGKYSGTVTVTIYEFNNKKSNVKTHGLNIEVKTTDKYSNTASSFIDFEEISSLIKGLDYLEGIKSNPTKFEHYEAVYLTNGGLKITHFNTKKGILVAIQVGRYSSKSVYLELSNLLTFKETIKKSYAEIKKIRS